MVHTKKENRTRLLIGITGYKQHGKDTLAKTIAECPPSAGKAWRGEWMITHFADPLKEMAKSVFGLSDEDVYTDQGKETLFPTPLFMDSYLRGMRQATGLDIQPRQLSASTPRQVLQYFGTEYVRSVAPSYWFDQLSLHIRGHNKVLVPDLRFLNEAEFLRSLGGVIIKVRRTDLPDSADNHPSEKEVGQIDPDLELGTVTGRFSLQERVATLISQGKFHQTSTYDFRKWVVARDAYLLGAPIERASEILSGSKAYDPFQNLLDYYEIPFRGSRTAANRIPHRTTAGITEKLCTACEAWKEPHNFNRNVRSWDQLASRCRECAAQDNKDRWEKYGKTKTLRSIHKRYAADAGRRSISWELTLKEMEDQYAKQNGRCYYSGVLLTALSGDPNCVSLDRVNSAKGYSKKNIVFCTQTVNMMKRDLSVRDFKRLVGLIHKHLSDKEPK
jgi:hypothetical protein